MYRKKRMGDNIEYGVWDVLNTEPDNVDYKFQVILEKNRLESHNYS